VPSTDRRNLLLDAAEQVLSRGGPQALTLNAVAAQAGVSKGGLLYHFSHKDQLISALVERLIDDESAALARWDDGEQGSFTRAYIASVTRAITSANSVAVLRRWSVILAACTEPDMQEPISSAFESWITQKPDLDRQPMHAQIARLAADGLWWNAQFVEAFRDPEFVRRIETALVEYAEAQDDDPDFD
jgi:AcrR family transcriptional regulator